MFFIFSLIGPPYAPRDLKVTRVVTRHAVLLSWTLPMMDDDECSNGCKVKGYRVCVVKLQYGGSRALQTFFKIYDREC